MRDKTEDEIIEDILDEFDFAKVRDVMAYLDWTWYDSDGTPTLGQLRKKARVLMKDCVGQEEYYIGTGGFHVTKSTFEGRPFYSLKFVVAEWDNYE